MELTTKPSMCEATGLMAPLAGEENHLATVRLTPTDGAVLIGRCMVGAGSNGHVGGQNANAANAANSSNSGNSGKMNDDRGKPEPAGTVSPGMGVHPKK